MFKPNPYRPGAGMMPLYLAGRESDIYDVEQLYAGILANIPVQSVVFIGLRGVGKTVLINQLQRNAEKKSIFCRHIEVETRNDFISQIAACSQAFLREVSTLEKVRSLIDKSIDCIKALVVSFDPKGGTFSLSMKEKELYQSVNLTQTLTDVFTSIGETAYEAERPICFFIDEMQYMKSEELGALIAALHRSNQLGYPVMIIGAGLPRLYKMLADEKTYSERLFIYKEISSLTPEQAEKAIRMPVKKLDIDYTEEAVSKIIAITKGYPFFIQQFCEIIYNNVDGDMITADDVDLYIHDFYNVLDTGFFKVRYERCSDMEKRFIFAMVDCGQLPCTISQIAHNMKKDVSAISTIRAQLINKGIIYPVRHGELDFTVPEFDGFIRRLEDFKYQ
ncbi:MAG: ATP-binding protein [Blautia sp.]|nr:ATP-binding protein [Blautia sp.]